MKIKYWLIPTIIFIFLFTLQAKAVTGDLVYWIFNSSANTLRVSTSLTSSTVKIGSLEMQTSSYLNWGAVTGTPGYGFRDNGGTMEFSNNGGSWTGIGTGGGGGAGGGVNTSTANFFTYYLTGTAVTGTSLMQLTAGTVTFSSTTNFSGLTGTTGTISYLNSTNVTSTGISATNIISTGVTSTNLNISGLTNIAGLTFTNATGTNANVSGLLSFGNGNGTSMTSTNAFFTNLVSTGATSTNLNISGLTNLASTIISNVTSTNLNISGLTNLGTLIFTSATGTNLNISGLTNLANTTITNVTSTNLGINGIVVDSNGSAGTGGQVLSQTGGKLIWATTSTGGGGSGTVTAGTAGQNAFYATSVSTVSGTNTLFETPLSRVGLNTTTPQSRFEIQGTGQEDPFYIVSSTPASSMMLNVLTNGAVGINSSTPLSTLSVTGINGQDLVNIGSSTRSAFNILADGTINLGVDQLSSNISIGNSTGATNVSITGGTAANTFSSSVTGNNSLSVTANSITTGAVMLIQSTATAISTGKMLSISKTASSGQTANNSILLNVAYTQTFNNGTSLTSTGMLANFSRTTTLGGTPALTHTVSGTLALFSNNANQTNSTGTLSDSADVVQILEGYATSTGAALDVTTAATSGLSMRINDDGTFFDPSPFVVDANGYVAVGSTTPQANLMIQGSIVNPFSIVTNTAAAASTFVVLTNGNVGINSSTPVRGLGIEKNGLEVNGLGVTTTNLFVLNTLKQTGTASLVSATINGITMVSNGLDMGTQAITNIGIVRGNQDTTVRLQAKNSNGTGNFGVLLGYNDANTGNDELTLTSGQADNLKSGSTFDPASGGAIFNVIDLATIINQNTAATGITRQIYINPTLTMTADNRALEIGSSINSTTQTNNVYSVLIGTSTYASSSAQTIKNASSFELKGAPAAGNNVTLGSSTAFYIRGNTTTALLGITTSSYAMWITGQTGALNNYNSVFMGGNVGIGSSTPSYNFVAQGSTALPGLPSDAGVDNVVCWKPDGALQQEANCTVSSARFKEHIESLSPQALLEEVKKLRAVSFNFKTAPTNGLNGNDTSSTGFIAEEVSLIDPTLVNYTSNYTAEDFAFEQKNYPNSIIYRDRVINDVSADVDGKEIQTPKTVSVPLIPQSVDYARFSMVAIGGLQAEDQLRQDLEARVSKLEGNSTPSLGATITVRLPWYYRLFNLIKSIWGK